MSSLSRRDLLKASAAAAAGLAADGMLRSVTASESLDTPQSTTPPSGVARIRFGVVGMNHGHIYGQVDAVIRGGGELVSFHAREPELAAAFARRYPAAKQVSDERAVVEDPSIQLVLSSIIPNERAPLGIRVMRAGKDYMADKPGITTLKQLAEVRRVQRGTGRIYSILYSERLENSATVRAGQLVQSGAIGKVVQTVGLGPHRVHPPERPAWFWDREKFGGIICDIGSHQMDQFLFFTGSTSAEVLAAQVRNVK
jgi:predicted dehydrogenase